MRALLLTGLGVITIWIIWIRRKIQTTKMPDIKDVVAEIKDYYYSHGGRRKRNRRYRK